uniref:NADH-ubiquinone oxidoreductase chain 2 n=1 Tax=Columbicola columbae TaxID=128991 RepID=A0A6G7SJX9_9NEOP|nr:NADH dehydrogenase subunit 2 [Columbicola columbae]
MFLLTFFWTSGLVILSFIFSYGENPDSFFLKLLLFISIMMKMGTPPFHGWMVQASENIPFNSFFFLNFISKFGPLLVFVNFLDASSFLIFAILVLILGSMGGWSLFSTHRFLVYSSIMNLSWAFSCLFSSKLLFVSYYFCYSVFFWFFFYYLEKMNESKINFPSMMPQGIVFKLLFFILIMNIMGTPPMCLFFLKFFSIKSIILQNMVAISFFLAFFTAVFMYMYVCVFSTQFFSKLDLFKKKDTSLTTLWFSVLFLGMTLFVCFL